MNWSEMIVFNSRYKKFESTTSEIGKDIKYLIDSKTKFPTDGFTFSFIPLLDGSLYVSFYGTSENSINKRAKFYISVYDSKGTTLATAEDLATGSETFSAGVYINVSALQNYVVQVTCVPIEEAAVNNYLNNVRVRGNLVDNLERYIV